jgi:hypothetical protein
MRDATNEEYMKETHAQAEEIQEHFRSDGPWKKPQSCKTQ